MKEYFLGLIVFAFVGAIMLSLAPDGKSKKYVRLLCGLCSIGCIAFPIFELVNNGGDEIKNISELFETAIEADEKSVEIYNDYVNYTTLKSTEEILKNDIIKGTLTKFDDIDIEISLGKNSGEFYIDEVTVYLYRSGYALDPKKIGEICQKRLGEECKIVYK
jgi:hypothetical protein